MDMNEQGFDGMTRSATALNDILADLEGRSRSFGSVLTGALRQATSGSKGLEDILRGVGTRLADIALSVGLKPLETLAANTVSGLLGGLTGGTTAFARGGIMAGVSQAAMPAAAFAKGGVVTLLPPGGAGAFSFAQGGAVTPFAQGGIVAAPTYFAMEGGRGLMGEAGPEAILPLKRGSDGALGIAASGGAGGGGPVQVVFNITTPDAESFRRSEGQIAAMLARSVGRGQRNI
mgnify:CR=1 FL=1